MFYYCSFNPIMAMHYNARTVEPTHEKYVKGPSEIWGPRRTPMHKCASVTGHHKTSQLVSSHYSTRNQFLNP